MGRPPTISRQQLLDTARRVFAQKGFEAATLADIARELNVTPAALLRHYPTKQALFAQAMGATRFDVPEVVKELARVEASSDPRIVLRQLAERFIPFIQKTIAENLAIYMHSRTRAHLVLPFDPRADDTPPKRGLRIVTDYFRRAAEAGVIRIRDPRAAALLFMGSLNSYVFFHQVLNVAPKPYPLSVYVDALIDLWAEGAMGGHHGKHQKSSAASDRAAGSHRRRTGHAPVHARQARTETADRLGNPGGANRQGRLTRRRPRHTRPRR
jgi:AcrR family transcriptional regulator